MGGAQFQAQPHRAPQLLQWPIRLGRFSVQELDRAGLVGNPVVRPINPAVGPPTQPVKNLVLVPQQLADYRVGRCSLQGSGIVRAVLKAIGPLLPALPAILHRQLSLLSTRALPGLPPRSAAPIEPSAHLFPEPE